MPPCPPLGDEAAAILAAFADLNTTRAHGMSGPLPLPATEISAWLDLNDIGSRRAHWAHCLRALDRRWLQWRADHKER